MLWTPNSRPGPSGRPNDTPTRHSLHEAGDLVPEWLVAIEPLAGRSDALPILTFLHRTLAIETALGVVLVPDRPGRRTLRIHGGRGLEVGMSTPSGKPLHVPTGWLYAGVAEGGGTLRLNGDCEL